MSGPQTLTRPLATRIAGLPEILERTDTPMIPEAVIDAALEALKAGRTHYTDRPGILGLRKWVSEHLQQLNIASKPDDVTITCGATEARFVIIKRLLSKDDTILCPGDPTLIEGAAHLTDTKIIHDLDQQHRVKLLYITPRDAPDIVEPLLAQAEHDVLASAILLTPSKQLAESVQVEVGRQMETLPRADIVAQSLATRSGIVITADLDEALSLSNAYGPEHLCLSVKDPWLWSEKVTAAGGIFMGEYSFEVLGDDIAGPSHVMPTGGTARFASPLNVWDFVHIISLVGLNDAVGRELSKPAAVIARSEGLEAHARSADRRGN